MDLHAIVQDVPIKVVVVKPKKAEVISVFLLDEKTMEHLLDIGHDGYWFTSEANENA